MPIFSQGWWLDVVCGEENWDVAIVEKEETIIASLPYHFRRRFGMIEIIMPPMTQILGVHLSYPPDQKHEKKLSFEKEMIGLLVDQLPQFGKFSQSFHYRYTNWLPFYWKNFSQTTRYTYIINDLSDAKNLLDQFNRAKRKNIRKAEKIIKVGYDLSAEEFYENHKLSLLKQKKTISYDFELFKNLYDSAKRNESGIVISAHDNQGALHAALFIVWDSNSAYDLISTIDPKYRNSGAASLLVWEALKYVSSKTSRFDFEGSMIENVETSFRQFGAHQVPYHKITKIPSKLLKLGQFVSDILQR